VRFGTSESVFNEGSVDRDFRVESTNNTHMLFVDATNQNVNVRGAVTADPANSMNISGNIRLGADGTTRGDTIRSAGGASSSYNGMVLMSNHINSSDQANSSLSSWLVDIGGSWADGTNFPPSTSDSFTVARRAAGGSKYGSAKYLGIKSNATVINEDSNNHDFRVESDSNANMLFVDAGNNQVGIKTASMNSYYSKDLVVSAVSEGGITIVGGSSDSQYLMFADGTSGTQRYPGYVQYAHSSDTLILATGANSVVNLSPTESVMNDQGLNRDFRVESDNNANAFFVDGSNGAKYFGTGTSQGTTGAGTFNIVVDGGDAINLKHNVNGNHMINMNQIGATTSNFFYFSKNGGGRGNISVSTSGTSYNTISDHRLKENVVPITGATARLKQLFPKRFNFIDDPSSTTVDGFIAHEVQTIVPEAVTGMHNEVNADGDPVYQGLDPAKLVPILVATIKELEARITALENT
jgi:hypothetical protein